MLLFTIDLTMSISLANGNSRIVFRINDSCWSFSQKCQHNVIIYTYCLTALQINKSLLKGTVN